MQLLKNKIVADIGGTNQKDEIKVVFLIVSDVLKNKNLLKAMSVISKIGLKQPEVIEKIKKSNSPKEIYELLAANDIELEHKNNSRRCFKPRNKTCKRKWYFGRNS